MLEQLRSVHELGFSVAHVTIRDPDPLPAIAMLATDVVPEISNW